MSCRTAGGCPVGARTLPVPLCRSGTARTDIDSYIWGAQELHQPAAFTSLPGKIWQPPCTEPLAPW